MMIINVCGLRCAQMAKFVLLFLENKPEFQKSGKLKGRNLSSSLS